MSPSDVFIRRPISTSLIMLGIAVVGVIAYRALPVSDLPNVDFPTITVGASLPGADPATMASAVASPLERQFTTIAGVDSMTSSSSTGSTNITLQFDLSRDIDSAAVDVQSAIAAAMPFLPAGMPSPPSFRKFNPAAREIIALGLVAPTTLPLSVIDDYAETMLAPQISMVNGVSQVNIGGQFRFAVRVQADPDKLRAERIGLNEIDQAIQNWNVNLPTGQLFGPTQTFNLRVNGQLSTAAQFRPLIVAYRHNAPVRLGQVAKVVDGVESPYVAAWLYTKTNGVHRTVSMHVMRQPGSNTVEVTDGIRRLLPAFRAMLPPTVGLDVRGDYSRNIREAFRDVQWTMALTVVLVIGVIFVFLHNWSATLIPALALPFSVLGTFAVMKLLGYTLDNLSMMALVLSLGFVVDDAIVMLENIVRHLERGERPVDAALAGSREIVYTILTMTVSLAAVFIPILFLHGVLGRLFREFAVTLTTAILISGLVSVTLTPMLCSRFLRVAALHAASGPGRMMEHLFARALAGYDRSLTFVLRHRRATLALFVAMLLATARMFVVVPKGFIPDQDMDAMNVNIRAAQGTSFYEMSAYSVKVADILQKNPTIDAFHVVTGVGPMNTAQFQVNLTPRAQRKLTAAQIAQQIRPQLGRFPGFRAAVTLPPAVQIGAHGGTSSYNFTIQSLDPAELYAWAPRMERAIAALPEVLDVSSDMEMKSPRVDLVIDRDKTAAVNLNVSQVETALYDGFGPKWSSTIYGPRAQYKVLVELDPKYQQQADSLQKVSFKASSGAVVPLQSLVRFRDSVGPQTIQHFGQLPSVTISFGLRPGVSLGGAVDHIQRAADALLPATVTSTFEGSAKVFQESMTNLGLLLVVAVGVVYIVLGALYESYLHPLTILSGLPSAGLGALCTLWLFGSELNIYSFVGLVLLVGIVKKNAIMQIDFALDAERRRGRTPAQAIHEGCLIRFRPIMMTTMAALLGAVPIALGLGAGGEARRPLGLAIVGGLVVSQFITLYLTPVAYTYLASTGNQR
jgi:HAE1 family hydrophobic/amphiphilic exporter-1